MTPNVPTSSDFSLTTVERPAVATLICDWVCKFTHWKSSGVRQPDSKDQKTQEISSLSFPDTFPEIFAERPEVNGISPPNLEILRDLCSHPKAPEEALLQICQYPELRHELAHRSEPLSVLKVLADRYNAPEAILTVGKKFYSDREVSVESFEEFLQRHVDCQWLLESLARMEPSSNEKLESFQRVIAQHENEAVLSSLLEEFRMAREARHETDVDRLQTLFESRLPSVWLSLAENPRVPAEMLAGLYTARNMKHAAKIRAAVQRRNAENKSRKPHA